jgi:hypothetical protein
MNTIQKRVALFLVGCIGARTLLAYTAKVASSRWLRVMGYLALIPAVGFVYLFLSGTRKTGPEVFGDKIWWNPMRPIHGLLYFLFAYNAINGNRGAWRFLALDVVIGLISFLWFHYMSGNFNTTRNTKKTMG